MQDNQSISKYQMLDLIRQTTINVIWLIVLLIIAAALGKYFIFAHSPKPEQATVVTVSKPVISPIVWTEVDKHLIEIVTQARQHTEQFIEPRISQWIDELMQRVDDDFLPWYFNYWNQQLLGLNGLYHEAIYWLSLSQRTAQERMTETVQEEFAKRVLRPEIAQLKIQHLAEETVKYYISQLQELNTIPQKYNIPPAEWERYLESVAVMTTRTEGNRETALSLKALTGTTVAGVAILTKTLAPLLKNVGAKVSAKLASKAAASIATKTGAKVMAKVGGEFLGPVVAIGIIIWDVWDHTKTKETGLPILRQNILDYFNELKVAILSDSEYGILTIIHQLEAQIVNAVNTQKSMSSTPN